MKWDLKVAVGAVVSLWHESQEKTRLSAEPIEICRWSRVTDQDEKPRYIEALVEAELIRPMAKGPSWDQGEYEIAGNEDECLRIVKLKQRAKKGGEATKRKWKAESEKVTQLKEGLKPTISPPQEGLDRLALGTVQFSAVQFSSNEIQEEESIGTPAIADDADARVLEQAFSNAMTNVMDQAAKSVAKLAKRSKYTPEHRAKGQAFAAAYVKAYQTRWPEGRPEDLNDGKTKGQIMNWIEEYPLDRARELIQAYFQIEAKWFQTKGYDFETFRRNLNVIGQALDSGQDPNSGIDWSKVNLS